MTNYFQGQDGFVWFTGVVEDRNDPTKLGRVRVRCVGYHTEDKIKIPTEDLPWAWVLQTVHTPSMNGMGHTPGFLVEGTWVVGFFRDPEMLQEPVILGSLPGVPENLGDPNKGFHDPNRRNNDPTKEGYNTSVYPRETGQPDTNRLARNFDLDQTVVASKKAKIIKNIEKADGEQYNEPLTSYNALYPKNHVFESESGHIIEYDDSPRHQRVHHYHASGTFNEIAASGDKIEKVVGDNYQLVNGSSFTFVNGHLNITTEGTLNIKCRKLNLEVSEDYTEEVEQNKSTLVKGNKTVDVTGEVFETFNSSYTQSIHGDIDLRYGKEDGKFSEHIKSDITRNYSAKVQEFLKETYEQNITESSTIRVGTTLDIDTAAFDVDASTVATITSATTTINGSSASNIRGATVTVNGTTVDIDASNFTLDAPQASTNVANTSLGAAGHGTSPSIVSPGSASVTDPTEVTETDLIEVLEPIIAISEPKSGTVGGDQDDEDAEPPRGNGSGSVGTGGRVSPQKTRAEGAVTTGASQPGNGGQQLAAQNPPGDCKRKTLGQVSERWESNGDPSATNDSAAGDDLGGWSYGLYQIATKNEAMKPFLTFCSVKENGFSDIHDELQAAGGFSSALRGAGGGFYNKWKELAKRDKERFKQCQHDYIQTVYYDRAVAKFFEFSGIAICDGSHSDGIQDAIWSTAVQHGANTSTIIDAFKATGKDKDTVTDEDLINAIYDQRGRENKEAVYVKKDRKSKWWGFQNYIPTEGGRQGGKVLIYNSKGKVTGTTPQLHRFRSSSGRIQKGVRNRYVGERASCLALNNNTRFNVGYVEPTGGSGGGQVV